MSDPRFLQSGFDAQLAHAIEEMGEALAAAGKTQRWGVDSVNPLLPAEQRERNADWLARELLDVEEAIGRLKVTMLADAIVAPNAFRRGSPPLSDVDGQPGKLPLAPRETAPFFVLIRTWKHPFQPKQATVYVKEGDFFRGQGGLTEEWGAAWTGITATSLRDALVKAHASEGTTCPPWKLEGDPK